MPIYEYLCQGCDHEFEELVLGSEQPTCPECQGDRLEKRASSFALKDDTTIRKSGAAAAALAPFSGGGPPGPCGSCAT